MINYKNAPEKKKALLSEEGSALHWYYIIVLYSEILSIS